jgi:hypothetical protein
MTAAELASRLDAAPTSSGWQAKCPSHEDHRASLSISEAPDGKILVRCHAGCDAQAICTAAGIRLADLFPKRNGKARFNIVATYDYRDEAGKLLFQVCRLDPKNFRQRTPDATKPGGWTWKTAGVRRVLFRLPEVLAAVAAGKTLFITEGEKDCLALVAAGFAATTGSGGALKWRDDYNESLGGADVVILPDKDTPGRQHAALVAESLHGTAKRVRVIELPDVDGKHVKDAADYFNARGTGEQLRELVAAAPDWQPGTLDSTANAKNNVATIAQLNSTAEDDKPRDLATLANELRGSIIAALVNKKLQDWRRKEFVSACVIDGLKSAGQFYFHAEQRDFESAMYFCRERRRLERIRADSFQAWLSELLGVNRTLPIFNAVVAGLETVALNPEISTGIIPSAFWDSMPGAFYLSNGDGSAVKITAGGVQLVDNGTDGVLFAVGRTLAPWKLCAPVSPFDTCRLFQPGRFIDAHGELLVRLWVYSLPSSPRCKPPLCLAGDIGSGKTRLAKGAAELYGLQFVGGKVEESREDDFWVNADGGGIYTLDNADSKCSWLGDALAAAATDGCSKRRKLYTNSDSVILRARAWLAITSANPLFAADSGLADRLLVVRMQRTSGTTSDAALTDEILAHRDAGLSHIAETLAAALADTTPTPDGLNQRHPDFARLAVRIGRALDLESETIHALGSAEADKHRFCLENDNVGTALASLVARDGTFFGTAADLQPKLIAIDADLDGRLSVKRLGKRLAALWPHIECVMPGSKREHNRTDTWVFTLKAPPTAGFAGFQTTFSHKVA